MTESVARIVATGGDYKKSVSHSRNTSVVKILRDGASLRSTSRCLCTDGIWTHLSVADSMSGTFNDIDVPPTLVSSLLTLRSIQDVITPEL